MKLHLLAFGKLRTPGLRDTADHYKKLLGSWITLDEQELKPLEVADKSEATRRKIQEREGSVLLARLNALGCGAFYLLEERGKALDSQGWANLVREWEASGTEPCFCVGSSLGFSDEVRKRARSLLSLGPQTLPHELARVVLMEQLYRAWSITRGHPYHNEGK